MSSCCSGGEVYAHTFGCQEQPDLVDCIVKQADGTLGVGSRPREARPTWDQWGLAMAKTTSLRADCSRAQHGAVILDARRRVVSVGYNGYPSGVRGCLDGGCPRGSVDPAVLPHRSPYHEGIGLCEAVHAEKNALLHGDWSSYQDGTIYITGQPCFYCLTDIKGSGLARALWPEGEWTK